MMDDGRESRESRVGRVTGSDGGVRMCVRLSFVCHAEPGNLDENPKSQRSFDFGVR
jgi:hypothetical protein